MPVYVYEKVNLDQRDSIANKSASSRVGTNFVADPR